jgi:hypothetical protein
MSSPHQLTPEIERAIVAYVRAGGFPHIAAEAAGVPRAVFERWLRRGQGPRASARFRAFYDAVQQARAQARLGAEVAALNDKPMDWLRSGPGRETADSAGWTGSVRPGVAAGAGALLLQPEVQALLTNLLRALEAHPEARALVAAVIESMSPPAADASPGKSQKNAPGMTT